MKVIKPYIHSITYYLPEKKLTNTDLAKCYPGWNEKKIMSKTGIQERSIAQEDEFVSDLGIKAADRLFRENDIDPQSIDFIILCTQSPDYLLPTTACILQERLGIPTSCGALDINLGCSGYVYGLALAKSLIQSGIAKNVLFVTSETYTKHIHPMDKSTRTIFGDGATATLVCAGAEKDHFGQFVLGTDGRGAQNLIIPAGGVRLPRSERTCADAEDSDGNIRSQNNLYMNGPEIFNFTIEVVPQMVNDLCEKNGIEIGDIDLFVFHQANKFMLDYLRDKMNVPREKFYVNLENTGNTVSSTIPIALKMAAQEGKLVRGNKVMLVGFGVGYSWGGTVIEW